MTPAEITALTNLALAARIALDTTTDGDARAHLREIEKHLTAIMRNVYPNESETK